MSDRGRGSGIRLARKSLKSSAGALERIHVCRVGSLMKAVDELHLNGIKVFASEMEATAYVADINFTEPCCVVMGGEENGVFPALMILCSITNRLLFMMHCI